MNIAEEIRGLYDTTSIGKIQAISNINASNKVNKRILMNSIFIHGVMSALYLSKLALLEDVNKETHC